MKKFLFYVLTLMLLAPAAMHAQDCDGTESNATVVSATAPGGMANNGVAGGTSGCQVPNPTGPVTLVVPPLLIQEASASCPDDLPAICAPPAIGVNGTFVLTITGFTGTFAGDVDLILNTPNGAIDVSTDNGGGDDFDGGTYTFSTAGVGLLDPGTAGAGPNDFAFEVPPTGDPNGDYTLSFCDDAGGDAHAFTGWFVTFIPNPPLPGPPVEDCPVDCVFTAPDVEIALEAGECEEVAFFSYTTDCPICPPVAGVPAGVLSGSPEMPLVETFDANGNLTGFSLDESGPGGPVAYSITIPADGNIGFFMDTNNSTFWDPFTFQVNGVTQSTGAPAGANFCFAVAAGDVLTWQVGSLDGVTDTGAYDVIVSNIVLSPDALPCYSIVQTSGPISGDYLAPGEYTVSYEVTLLNEDPANPCGFIAEPSEEVLGTVTVLAYSGPVTSSLACNDHVNISLDENCEALLGADNFLEGGPYSCYTDYTVAVQPFSQGDFVVIEQLVPVSLPCGDHTYMVTSPAGNTCWGTFTVEDKIAPEFVVADLNVLCTEDVPLVLIPEFDASFIPILEAPVTISSVGTSSQAFEFEIPCPEDDCVITDVNIYVNLVHSWIGDLDIIIIAPDGTQNDLISFGGCFGQDWPIDAIFDEECPNDLMNSCFNFDAGGECVWSGGGLLGNLSQYNGGSACGTWQLIINDNAGGDGGVVNQVALMLNNGDGSCNVSAKFPTPDPVACDCQSYSYEDAVVQSDCGIGTITRTWYCVDKAGNRSEGQVQTISVEPLALDGLGDTWFVPPSTIFLPCGTGTDPWDIVAYFDDPKTNDCPDSDVDCPDAVYEFNEGIAFGFPYYFAWGCNSNCSAKVMEHAQPIDNNVCNLFVTYTDQVLPACGPGCPGNVKVIRTWTVLDWCTSQTVPYVQLIKSVDDEAPEITAPNITLSVNPWGCVASGALPGPEHLYDACSGPGDLSYTVSGPAGVAIITMTDSQGNFIGYGVTGAPKGDHVFTYTAVDCCGNVGTGSFTVSVVDDTPPVAIAKENIVISLTSGGSDPGGYAKLYTNSVDNGSHDGDCGPVKLEMRRPGGAPDCGNLGQDAYNNNVTFNNNGDPDDNNKDTDAGAFVKFCCDDLSEGNTYQGLNGPVLYNDSMVVVLRVWDDGNCDGIAGGPSIDKNGDGDRTDPGEHDNYNETWAYVQVENKLPPVIICPPNATIACDMDYSLHLDAQAPATDDEYAMLTAPDFGTGVATAAGVCAQASVTYKDRYNEDICYDRVNEITRTWCVAGTSICCDQKIDIVKVGAFDPSTISWNNGFPEELVELECMEDEVQEPSWQEAPCDLIGWSLQSDTFQIEGDACLKVINLYTVADWCADEFYTFEQVVKIIDNEDPVVVTDGPCIEVDGTALAAGGTCEAEVTLCAVGTDPGECESPWLKWQVLVDLNSNWTYDHVFSSYVSPIDPNFNTPLNEYYVAPSAPGDEVCITLPLPVGGSKYDHRAVWKLSDGCQNNSSLTVTFQVTDKKAPTPYCYSVSSALMTNGGVELWACDFVLDMFDNCTPADLARYTFNGPDEGYETPESTPGWNDDTQCEGKEFTCDDISSDSNVVSVKVYTWDECNNWDVCYVELTLTPNGCPFDDDEGSSRIAGAIGTEYGDMVEGVNVTISSNQPEYPMTLPTNAAGQFTSDNHENTENYTVTANKNDDPRNGVSTLDIILIQRHILNLASLTSPYQYIAADANDDQKITVADIVDIRKLILEVYDAFPSNDSWRFVDATQSLTTTNAFAFNEVLDINYLSTDMMHEDFTAVKIGDVNGSVIANAKSDESEVRSGKALNFSLNSTTTTNGVDVAVSSSNFAEIMGYQFTMKTAGMELTGVSAGAINVSDENVAVLDANTVTMSWNSLEAVSVANDVLFTLHFAGKDATSNVVLNSEITRAEAYDAGLNVMSVTLGSDVEAEFALMQNEPNPFSVQTVIEFTLPSAGDATLKVLDVTGKVVKQLTGTYAKGNNSIVLTKAELGTSGVLYYQLESGDYTATKKMIIVE